MKLLKTKGIFFLVFMIAVVGCLDYEGKMIAKD